MGIHLVSGLGQGERLVQADAFGLPGLEKGPDFPAQVRLRRDAPVQTAPRQGRKFNPRGWVTLEGGPRVGRGLTTKSEPPWARAHGGFVVPSAEVGIGAMRDLCRSVRKRFAVPSVDIRADRICSPRRARWRWHCPIPRVWSASGECGHPRYACRRNSRSPRCCRASPSG